MCPELNYKSGNKQYNGHLYRIPKPKSQGQSREPMTTADRCLHSATLLLFVSLSLLRSFLLSSQHPQCSQTSGGNTPTTSNSSPHSSIPSQQVSLGLASSPCRPASLSNSVRNRQASQELNQARIMPSSANLLRAALGVTVLPRR